MKRKSGAKIDYLHSLFHKEEQNNLLRADCQRYHFFWEDIEFEKGFIRLKNPKTILPHIPLRGSLPILNEIKDDYFKRIHPNPIKFYFLKSIFQQGLSKDWEKLSLLVEPALEYAAFRFTTTKKKRKVGRFTKISAKQVLNIYSIALEKSEYLHFLASKQDEGFSIIPIIEFQNNQHEESFIFRYKTSTERILIAWENSKGGRATHLFIADDKNLEQRLTLIESFIIDSLPSKRRLLHENGPESRIVKKQLLYIESIRHENLRQFKSDLAFAISSY